MIETPFHEFEKARGADFGESHGWMIPRRFPRGRDGLAPARLVAGIADLTATGRIKITGADRIDLLQRISTNDLSALGPGGFAPTLFVTAKGRIIDRALVIHRGDALLLLTAPAGRERLRAWIERTIFSEDFQMTDLSGETAAFALSGPGAARIVSEVCGVRTAALAPGCSLNLPIADVETTVAPFDGLPSGWIFIAETPGIREVYAHVLRCAEPLGAIPIGEDDAEVLRVEAGIPADGHELTEDWNPWEAGVRESFSLTKGCYTGQEVIARLDTYEKVQRGLVGLRFGAAPELATPARVYGVDAAVGEKELGMLTSAVASDRFEETIGLAIIRRAFGTAGTAVTIGEGRLPAIVAELPFV